MSFGYLELDVFARGELNGNPVGVVLGADALAEPTMAAFARWTNFSETTFVLRATTPGADYRLRIFTPGGELPFAGHPTLGSAAAVLDAAGGGLRPLVQECGGGLVRVVPQSDGLAFLAPPLLRSGPVEGERLARLRAALGLAEDDVQAATWADNGPGWIALRLRDATAVLAVRPDFASLHDRVGLIGAHPAGGVADFEVRAFAPAVGVDEDPVTGSLNAAIAQWFFAEGFVAGDYTVRQGTALGRGGAVTVCRDAEGVWVGGRVDIRVRGRVELG